MLVKLLDFLCFFKTHPKYYFCEGFPNSHRQIVTSLLYSVLILDACSF